MRPGPSLEDDRCPQQSRRRVPIPRWRNGSAKDEDGAVAVLVAICLVAVMGMVAMTIDVGSLLLRRRALVNSSDAAALAAAQSCYSTKDTDVPETVADAYAMNNSGGLTATDGGIVPGKTVGCDSGRSGHVTVRYGQDDNLFFAPVLGQDTTAHVGTVATASWGAAGGAAPMPLVLNAGALQGPCNIPDVPPGVTCSLWYDNNVFSGSAFGFLDLKDPGGWDVQPGDNCNNAGGANLLRDWINGSASVGQLLLNYPFASYVCVDGGLRGNVSAAVWGEVTKLIGQTRDFPINGVSPADGGVQILQNGQVDKYNIIGFAHLKIMNVLTVAQAGGTAPPTAPVPSRPRRTSRAARARAGGSSHGRSSAAGTDVRARPSPTPSVRSSSGRWWQGETTHGPIADSPWRTTSSWRVVPTSRSRGISTAPAAAVGRLRPRTPAHGA